MRVVITGGAGFIGQKLATRLLKDGVMTASDGTRQPIEAIVLFDRTLPSFPSALTDARIIPVAGDIADRRQVQAVITPGTASVFHLAAVVSAEAEADLDTGLRVNLDGTRAVLDGCRHLAQPPRFVFASSAAVYGGRPPLHVTDATQPNPATSYGVQKLCGEHLVSDYTRRGLIDGRSLRLPTIAVRPGRPNKAASTFVSSIVRDPLSGERATCPVKPESRMAILSPRRLIDCMMRIHEIDSGTVGAERTFIVPGLETAIADIAAAVQSAGGDGAASLVDWVPDPAVQKIVDGWPASMTSARSQALGLWPDGSIDDIIRAFIEDDLPAQRAMLSAKPA